MIIFDLDGTLADCEHRRHFVDPEKNPEIISELENVSGAQTLQNMRKIWYYKAERMWLACRPRGLEILL